jgi:isopenicillin N synthase-like dioxygenase
MLPTALKLSFNEVPIVDLAPLASGAPAARATVAAELAEACARVGFVYLKNCGITQTDVDAIFATARDFHDLPLEAKMEVSITKNGHAQGYLHGKSKGVHDTIAPNQQEAFQIRRPLALDDPDLTSGKPLHGPIPWPSAMPDLEPRMMAFYAKADALGYQLLDLFELGLELEAGTLKQYFKKDMNSLRLLHYPPQDPDDASEQLGARAHTDTNAFTILVQDPNGGLEIRNRDGAWVAVPPVPGTFVLNVGEVLKVWTDGIFSSTVHRVVNRSGKRRYSIPFFMYPSYDALIRTLLTNPDPSNVAPEDLHTSMPRDTPFVYGERKARSTANIMPGKITVPT